jgi:hypothetical protein
LTPLETEKPLREEEKVYFLLLLTDYLQHLIGIAEDRQVGFNEEDCGGGVQLLQFPDDAGAFRRISSHKIDPRAFCESHKLPASGLSNATGCTSWRRPSASLHHWFWGRRTEHRNESWRPFPEEVIRLMDLIQRRHGYDIRALGPNERMAAGCCGAVRKNIVFLCAAANVQMIERGKSLIYQQRRPA